jgi:hypothetical protein
MGWIISMIAAGLVAAALAWALPSFAVQAHTSGRTCERYRSTGDVAARLLARDAEVAAETIATDNQGTYTNVSPRTIHAAEPVIPITPEQARHEHRDAYLLSASGTTSSYVLTTRSRNDDTYTLLRSSSGLIKRRARVCDRARNW